MAITYIATQMLSENFFEGWTGGLEGIDTRASVECYIELLTERLRAQFPGAEINIDLQLGASGASGHWDIDSDSEDNAHHEVYNAQTTIEDIEEHLYQEIGDDPDGSYIWIVKEDAP